MNENVEGPGAGAANPPNEKAPPVAEAPALPRPVMPPDAGAPADAGAGWAPKLNAMVVKDIIVNGCYVSFLTVRPECVTTF